MFELVLCPKDSTDEDEGLGRCPTLTKGENQGVLPPPWFERLGSGVLLFFFDSLSQFTVFQCE